MVITEKDVVVEITKKQEHIIRHSLGIDYAEQPYRNYYMIYSNSDGFDELEKLVELGLMTRRRNNLEEVNKSYIYHVTDKGLAALGF